VRQKIIKQEIKMNKITENKQIAEENLKLVSELSMKIMLENPEIGEDEAELLFVKEVQRPENKKYLEAAINFAFYDCVDEFDDLGPSVDFDAFERIWNDRMQGDSTPSTYPAC